MPQSPRRILSIWLARLAIDRWRLLEGCSEGEGADAQPIALVTDTAHGPRIDAANRAGLDAGAHPGMRLADARALCPVIAVRPSDPAGDLAFLENLAVWAQRWGPWSALDPPDGLVIDVTGAAHLFGGEDTLIGDAARALSKRGLAARLAIAPTAGAAWALAHHGPDHFILTPPSSLRAKRSNPEPGALDSGLPRGSAPRNDEFEYMANVLSALPVAALRLDDETSFAR